MDRQPAEAGPPATGVREPDVPGRTSSVIQDMQLSLLGKESSASLQFVNSARDRISSLPKEEQITFPDLNLPAIVVIGGQNAGKSTVLERLMGLDAIPRGAAGRRSDSMSSTKCPIETRLVRAVDGKERCEVKFNNKKHTGPLSILPGVLRDLNKEAAMLASARDAQVDIYDEPIIVTIHSHAVIEELTFIDLPGIIITDEEKTKGNASRTLALAKKHCLDKSKIILLVMNATVDLSQVPGITTLREVQESNTDEEVWRRTIGVYTKLDTLIDSAKTDTGSKLFLDAIAARVKRPGQQTHMSQSFLLSNMNIDHTSFNGKKTWSNKDEEVKELECLDRKNWPENSESSYNAVAGSCGVAALRSALSRVLAMRVEQGLKSIREKLESHLAKISLELEKLPPAIEESRKGVELSIKLQELCKSLTSRSGREIKLSVIEVADLSEPARHLKKIRETFFTEITKLSMPFFTAEGFNNSFQIIWKEASAEHASQDPGQLVLSPFGRIKVMGKFLEPMRRRAVDLCNEVRETVCSKIVKASIEAVFAAYPDLIKEVTKILLDDTGCSLWERQAALANAEVQAHLDSLCQLFDSASDIEHEKNVLQHHIDNLQLKAKLNDTVFEMSAQLMLRVKSIKSVIFRILYMRLLEDPLMTIESSVANLQSKNDLQNGEICVWQQNLFGTQLSRATRDALSKIPQESLHALPKALKKFLATADRWNTLCMAFRQDKGVEIKRSKLLHQQDTAKELLDGWHRIHNARI